MFVIFFHDPRNEIQKRNEDSRLPDECFGSFLNEHEAHKECENLNRAFLATTGGGFTPEINPAYRVFKLGKTGRMLAGEFKVI